MAPTLHQELDPHLVHVNLERREQAQLLGQLHPLTQHRVAEAVALTQVAEHQPQPGERGSQSHNECEMRWKAGFKSRTGQ